MQAARWPPAERPPEFCEFARCHPHLADDIVDGNLRAKIIAWYRDVDTMGVQAGGEMAERRTVERLPVSAMNENYNRARAVARKKIDPVARPRAVRHHMVAALTCLAIGFRIPRPAGDQRGISGNPRAIIVFDLVIHIRVQRISLF